MFPLVPKAVPLMTDILARTALDEGAPGPPPSPRSPFTTQEGTGERCYHLVFQGPFKSEPSLTGAPAVNHDHGVAQRRQSVKPQILDSFEGVIDQLHLWGRQDEASVRNTTPAGWARRARRQRDGRDGGLQPEDGACALS